MALSCNPEKLRELAIDSNWIFGNPLPIQFEFTSALFPENQVDNLETIAITSSSGVTKVTILSSGYETYECGSWVQITDSENYSGVWKITSFIDSNEFIINAPYTQNETATLQRYYQNYWIAVEVYAGLPSWHLYESERPTKLITTYHVKPKTGNTAIVDVGDAVRSTFPQIINDICGQKLIGYDDYINDRNAWTSFYVKYYEIWEEADANCDATTFETAKETSDLFFALNGTSQFQYKYGGNAGEYILNDNNLTVPTKFLTDFDTPTYFVGYETDLTLIIPQEVTYNPWWWVVEGVTQIGTVAVNYVIVPSEQDCGVYRLLLHEIFTQAEASLYPEVIALNVYANIGGERATEIKQIKVNRECLQYEGFFVRFLNTLGAWESWLFGAGQDVTIDITKTVETRRNIFADMQSTYIFGDTEADLIDRQARRGGLIRSQRLSKDERDYLMLALRQSIKVQKVKEMDTDFDCLDLTDKLTIIIEQNSITTDETDKQYFLSFAYKETQFLLSQKQ